MVLGIGLVTGDGVSVGLLAAIFVSTCPRPSGRPRRCARQASSNGIILRLWIAVAALTTLATVVGYAIADSASGDLQATINGFAAGALLVMLIDSMIPAATRKAHDLAGLASVLGFAVAAALSNVG